MTTEIIKLKTVKSNFKEALSKIYKRLSHTNSQITVIIKNTEAVHDQQLNSNILHRTEDDKEEKEKSMDDSKDEFRRQSLCKIIGIDEQQEEQFEESVKVNNFQNLSESFNIGISTKFIFPNLEFTQRTDCKNKLNMIRSQKKNEKMKIYNSTKNLPSLKKNMVKSHDLKAINTKQNDYQLNQFYSKQSQKQAVSENGQEHRQGSPQCQPPSMIKLSITNIQQVQNQENYLEEISSEVNSFSEQSSIAQSLFIVQDKLNDAISYIKLHKIFQLEEYLYQFKTQFISLSDKVQIKWRLLMAHCKEYRKQYERASILYQQVIQMSENSPKSLLIQVAQIYHRLGICYTQNRRWNDGIKAFASALKNFKKSQRSLKYAQCMNNLGALYLAAYQVEQAEKCFYLSYQIKKNESPNPNKLISSLLNLYECNLMQHNYLQAEEVLKQAEKISESIKDKDMLSGGLERRKGKLLFLRGELEQGNKSYCKALELMKKYPYSLEYGQLCSNIGVIRLQESKLGEARQLFESALQILNFYYTRDSQQIKSLRSNIELIQKMEEKSSQCKQINNSDIFMKKDHIKQKQNVFFFQ